MATKAVPSHPESARNTNRLNATDREYNTNRFKTAGREYYTADTGNSSETRRAENGDNRYALSHFAGCG